MGVVMIQCPETDKALPTGISMDEDAFASSTFEGKSVPCLHCGKTHIWSKRDAWVAPDNS